jgi:hypothetical protein
VTDLVLQIADQLGHVRIGPGQHVSRHRGTRQLAIRRNRHGNDPAVNAIASDHDNPLLFLQVTRRMTRACGRLQPHAIPGRAEVGS